jgi:uncharacterized membrane protein YfcA
MTRALVHLRSEKCDAFGMSISGLCLFHCVLSPLVFVVFPAAEAYLPGDDATHHALGLMIMVTGAIAFARAYDRHRQRFVLALLIVGMAMLGAGSYGHHFIRDEWVNTLLVMSGSVTLLGAHYLNRTFCRLCSSCQH